MLVGKGERRVTGYVLGVMVSEGNRAEKGMRSLQPRRPEGGTSAAQRARLPSTPSPDGTRRPCRAAVREKLGEPQPLRSWRPSRLKIPISVPSVPLWLRPISVRLRDFAVMVLGGAHRGFFRHP